MTYLSNSNYVKPVAQSSKQGRSEHAMGVLWKGRERQGDLVTENCVRTEFSMRTRQGSANYARKGGIAGLEHITRGLHLLYKLSDSP